MSRTIPTQFSAEHFLSYDRITQDGNKRILVGDRRRWTLENNHFTVEDQDDNDEWHVIDSYDARIPILKVEILSKTGYRLYGLPVTIDEQYARYHIQKGREDHPDLTWRDDWVSQIWLSTNSILRSYAYKIESGYDKVDFIATWNNGLEYKGTFEVDAGHKGGACIGTHILQNLRFSSGQRPHHLTEEQYQHFFKFVTPESRDYAQRILDTCEIITYSGRG